MEKWTRDIDYLQENLPKDHINLYHTITKSQFDAEIASLKNDLPNLADYQVKCRLAQIVASIGDAHTALWLFPTSNTDYYAYPLIVRWFGRNLIVLGGDPTYKKLFGQQLIDINGIPINRIATKVDPLISHENNQWLRAFNPSYIMLPSVLRFFNVTKADKAQFSFSDNKGTSSCQI